MATDAEPQIYLVGGTDELFLEEEGRVFHPGDAMPRTLTNAKRASLQAAGIRFETRHPEPESTPVPAAVEAAAAPTPTEAPRRAAKE